MTKFEGESIRLRVTATDYDGNAITGDVATPPVGTIELYDTLDVLVLSGDLTWDATLNYWYYDIASAPAGSFQVKAMFTGTTYQTWEYAKLKIKENPV